MFKKYESNSKLGQRDDECDLIVLEVILFYEDKAMVAAGMWWCWWMNKGNDFWVLPVVLEQLNQKTGDEIDAKKKNNPTTGHQWW